MKHKNISVKRTPLHSRKIHVQGYLREDDLWDVEAVLADTKGYDIELFDRGRIPAGEGFLHYMTLMLTVDSTLMIRDAQAIMAETPYKDCSAAGLQYKKLIGIRIQSGWMNEARRALGRSTSCTHLTELLPVLATAAIQTINGYQLFYSKQERSASEKNRKINSCHGFRKGSRAQQYFWPSESDS
jgi:hypothetical protein